MSIFLQPDLPNAQILYQADFINKREADHLFDLFIKELRWEQHSIKIFGKEIPQPRLTALYGANNLSYTYSNLQLQPHSFTQELKALQEKLVRETGVNFSHCLANLYRNERDSMGWHADDEKVLGKNPIIASISLGAARNFQLRHKFEKEVKYKLDLHHGSLLLMKGETQHFYKHQLPKIAKPATPRINLTFRRILM